MIIFLSNHPEKNETISSTDCMTGEQHARTVKDAGSKIHNRQRRYWVSMIDNDTGEIVICEYELVDIKVMS